MAEEIGKLSIFFKALGHPIRLRLFQILRKRRFRSCGMLVGEFSLAQSTISQHLEILRKAGLIRWEGIGNQVCYQIDEAGVERFRTLVEKL